MLIAVKPFKNNFFSRSLITNNVKALRNVNNVIIDILLFVVFAYVLIKEDEFLAFQVLFPSGAKVTLLRRGHGLDITVFAPRAKNRANEKGLCLYDWQEDGNTYGNSLK